MKILKVFRLDHLGIISSVIKDLGLIDMIDKRIPKDEKEHISTGEAIAGMILSGLGFSNRPLSLTPQFFNNKPLELLFRKGVQAEHFNRFKLGRSLDKVYNYDCDLLFSELALNICQQENVDLRFSSLDTTSFSLSGDYIPDNDEQAIEITYGYSKAHRPDLKQAVLEIVVSQDGGIPFVSKGWSGNSSDNKIFNERLKELIKNFENSETPRYLIADSKLYTQENAINLANLSFITRIPGVLNIEQELIDKALTNNNWRKKDENLKYQVFEICHYDITQRWIVVHSKYALQRVIKTIDKVCQKEFAKIHKQLFHLQAKRFESKEMARAALAKIQKKLKYHLISEKNLIKHIKYACKGKPTIDTPIKSITWQIEAVTNLEPEKIEIAKQRKACFIIATNISEEHLNEIEIIDAYKGQNKVERGFRFLKDPLFFVSSLFLKNPSRIQGLLMVMTLALLVYSIAERRMRKILQEQNDKIPNQINQPTSTPTLRWIFQLLEGINVIIIKFDDTIQLTIEGITDLRRKILQLFGQEVCQLYQIFL